MTAELQATTASGSPTASRLYRVPGRPIVDPARAVRPRQRHQCVLRVRPRLCPDVLPSCGPTQRSALWRGSPDRAVGRLFPSPPVSHEPYLLSRAGDLPTLALTIHTDGRVEPRLVGASSFPRHWVYDYAGRLVAKSGFIDHDTWWREAYGAHTPWGDEESAPIVTAVESALERQLSVAVIDAKPQFRRLEAGRTLVEQGEQGDELFLLFDGVLRVEIDGEPVAEVGPGAILGRWRCCTRVGGWRRCGQ